MYGFFFLNREDTAITKKLTQIFLSETLIVFKLFFATFTML